jgi:hypothetical protein
MTNKFKLNENGKAEIQVFKSQMRIILKQAMDLMPSCKEKSVFNNKMKEAIFYGVRSIANKTEFHIKTEPNEETLNI